MKPVKALPVVLQNLTCDCWLKGNPYEDLLYVVFLYCVASVTKKAKNFFFSKKSFDDAIGQQRSRSGLFC